MTATSILIVCAIALAFLLFGGVLAWGDFYSRGRPGDPAAAPDRKPSAVTDATTNDWRSAA
jgi:hypothetical protein